MKRSLVFILALIYLVTTTGITIHQHFCMGELAGWSLWVNSQEDACDACGMEKDGKPNGCCNDEQTWLKIEDNQKTHVYDFQLAQYQPAEAIHFSSTDISPFVTNAGNLLPQSNAPPRSKVAIHKRNRVFLI